MEWKSCILSMNYMWVIYSVFLSYNCSWKPQKGSTKVFSIGLKSYLRIFTVGGEVCLQLWCTHGCSFHILWKTSLQIVDYWLYNTQVQLGWGAIKIHGTTLLNPVHLKSDSQFKTWLKFLGQTAMILHFLILFKNENVDLTPVILFQWLVIAIC